VFFYARGNIERFAGREEFAREGWQVHVIGTRDLHPVPGPAPIHFSVTLAGALPTGKTTTWTSIRAEQDARYRNKELPVSNRAHPSACRKSP
jgi:hypothetical protein